MDYRTVPSLLPATFTPFTQAVVIDIDGDKINELIVLSPDIGQLAVIHQFSYHDLSSSDWLDETPQWWNLWTTPALGTIPGGWTVQLGDTMIAGDFDGDGLDELFLYNTSTLAWAIVKWQPSTNGLQTICHQPNGCPNWQPQTGDSFVLFPTPVAGSAASGLLAFNGTNNTLGVLQYSAGALTCPTVATSSVDGWNFDDSDQFYAGHFTSQSTGSFLIFHPSDGYLACLTWDGSAFHVSQGQHGTLGKAPGGQGTWNIQSNDTFRCADLNGDGFDELVVYNPGDKNLGAWQWVAAQSQFQCLDATSEITNWTIGDSDQYYAAPARATTGLFAYNSTTAQVALLHYASGYVCDEVSANLNYLGGFPVSTTDRYYVAQASSPLTPRVFAVSPQSPLPRENPVSTLVALLANNGNLGANIAVESSVALPAPGWTAALLAEAPTTPFPAFSAQYPDYLQDPIYQYVSKLFPENTGGDLRSHYGNAEWAGKFAPFGQNLPSALNPPGLGFQLPDWQNVCRIISKECNCVDTVYTAYNDIPQLARNMAAWQVIDLQTVKANILNSLPPLTTPPSLISYWTGQFVVAALWGGAALSGDPVVGAIGSVLASLLGSALAMQTNSNVDPFQTSYDQIDSLITDTFLSLAITSAPIPNALLTDPVKLRIFDELSGTTWMLPTLSSQFTAAFEAADRRSMYAQLLPSIFQIAVLTNLPSGTPEYRRGIGNHPWIPFTGSNPDSYSATPAAGNQGWNINALYASIGGNFVEPSAILTNDLKAIGVVMTDLLSGIGPWSSIPRVTFVQDIPPA